MKVRVTPELCQGHTLCSMIAPTMFELDEIDGHSTAVSEDVPADQQDAVSQAALSCPERAISLF